MGAHTALTAIDRARGRSLTGRAVLTGVAALAMVGGGAGTALAVPSQQGTGNVVCGAEGGDLHNDAVGTGLGGIGQGAGPIASGNTGQLLSCNSFLNDNLNDVSVNIFSRVVDNDGNGAGGGDDDGGVGECGAGGGGGDRTTQLCENPIDIP